MPLEGVRILLVTRDRPVHDRIRTLCSRIAPTFRGLEWTGSYRAALDAVETGAVDICILDTAVVDGAGMNLLHEPSVRRQRIPVILLLAQPPHPDEDPLARPGVADWIVKDELDLSSLQRGLRHARQGRDAAPTRSRSHLEAVRPGHELLSTVVEGVPDALFVKDNEGRYVMMNEAAAARAERPVEEVVGRLDDEIFDAPMAGLLRRRDREVLESGERITFEETVEAPGGVMRTYRITKGPVRGRDGEITGLYGIARDVTPEAQTARALRKENTELQGRVRTLETLLGVTTALRAPGLPLDQRLERIAGIVCKEGVLADRPTDARIVLHGKEFRTRGFDAAADTHSIPIRSEDGDVGRLEVVVSGEEVAESSADPSPMAELLDRIARELGTIPPRPDDAQH